MNSADLVARMKEERDRHVIGYPGPRRDVAELLDNSLDRIEALEAWKAEAMEVLLVVAAMPSLGHVQTAARRLVEKEDGR